MNYSSYSFIGWFYSSYSFNGCKPFFILNQVRPLHLYLHVFFIFPSMSFFSNLIISILKILIKDNSIIQLFNQENSFIKGTKLQKCPLTSFNSTYDDGMSPPSAPKFQTPPINLSPPPPHSFHLHYRRRCRGFLLHHPSHHSPASWTASPPSSNPRLPHPQSNHGPSASPQNASL